MNQTDPVTTHQELCGRTEELDYFQHPMINDSMKEFLIVGSNQQLKRVHEFVWVRIGWPDQITHLWC